MQRVSACSVVRGKTGDRQSCYVPGNFEKSTLAKQIPSEHGREKKYFKPISRKPENDLDKTRQRREEGGTPNPMDQSSLNRLLVFTGVSASM